MSAQPIDASNSGQGLTPDVARLWLDQHGVSPDQYQEVLEQRPRRHVFCAMACVAMGDSRGFGRAYLEMHAEDHGRPLDDLLPLEPLYNADAQRYADEVRARMGSVGGMQ